MHLPSTLVAKVAASLVRQEHPELPVSLDDLESLEHRVCQETPDVPRRCLARWSLLHHANRAHRDLLAHLDLLVHQETTASMASKDHPVRTLLLENKDQRDLRDHPESPEHQERLENLACLPLANHHRRENPDQTESLDPKDQLDPAANQEPTEHQVRCLLSKSLSLFNFFAIGELVRNRAHMRFSLKHFGQGQESARSSS